MHRLSHLQRDFILCLLLTLIIRSHSIIFVNLGDTCVDVSVEENRFPLSLIQSSAYYQVCSLEEQHWRRFGWSEFRLHIHRTSEPLMDKEIYLYHNGYIHLYPQNLTTVAKWNGAKHEDL